MDDDYMFYAFNSNGHTASIYVTPDEALDELSLRLSEDDTNHYEIEPINGIWHLLERMGDFDDRFNNDWMVTVLEQVIHMVTRKKELAKQSKEDSSNKTDSKKTNT